MRLSPIAYLPVALCSVAWAQQNQNPLFGPKDQSVVVTGTFEPLPLDEVDRSVRLFLTTQFPLLSNTFVDYLKLDPSLDLRQRAPDGLQGDLSIRGGTFGQTLILLNGIRFNDSQSGHHNLDIPLPLESIARIEALKGTGSMMYGSDAVGGVVNFVTVRPEASEFRLRTAFGNFGVNQERAGLAYAAPKFSEQASFSRDFSTGFRPDRDYRNLSGASLTHLSTALGMTDITLAAMDRPFGADQFYGNYPSWERTRTWFSSVRQELGERTEAVFAFRRHTDLFVLYRDHPEIFTNRHADEGYQGSLRRWDSISKVWKLYYGAEFYHDEIDSTNLGSHSRSHYAGYFGADARVLGRASVSFGVRDEVYGSFNQNWNPTVSGGYWLSQHWKLRASASRAFRLPTYTDLYYHDPANLGSPNLKPESAWGYEGGLDWNPGKGLRGELVVFERREHNGIDYVRSSPTDIWRATNFENLNFTGVEAALIRTFGQGQVIDVRYTGLRGAQDVLSALQSKYVFNYPKQNAVVTWQAPIGRGFAARASIGVTERYARDPYAIWNLSASRITGRVRPFVQLTNLTSTNYEEIPGVAMPRRGVVGGLEWIAIGHK